MRIDVFTIFPQYLAPLELSLLGKARKSNLLNLQVHDLRDFTYDVHRTVDDSPYGGGAGMVMKADVWGEALDSVCGLNLDCVAEKDKPVLVIPTPIGEKFSQNMATQFSKKTQLVFACGRYEGIDERFFAYAKTRLPVRLVSLGDYVLNGGEVAALAIIEAVARLLPGVIGNPNSLLEESHSAGLLEYPIYTKPRVWRGYTVPEVLLSGDHNKIASWRKEAMLVRTESMRPDLLKNKS